jgi:putative transcriptional regulator
MINVVKEERAQQKLTQADLAAQVGVSRQTIISIETGRYLPSIVLAIKLANALEKRVEELFQLEASD